MRAKVRRNRREEKKKVVLFGLVTFLLVFMIGLTCGSFLSKAKEADISTSKKYYTSIEIKPGDTLWELAEAYMDDHYDSKESYIAEVLTINSIKSEDHIVSGQYIILPYYDSQL